MYFDSPYSSTYKYYSVNTGWVQNGSTWYYINKVGNYAKAATGWLSTGGNWYYLESDGRMVTGWVKVSGYWYYMDSSGKMLRGWLLNNNKWYYLRTAKDTPTGGTSGGPDGSMLVSGSWPIGGKTYHFDASGACTNPY